MKTEKDLNILKEEVKNLNEKLHELSEEELKQVIGGIKVDTDDESSWIRMLLDFFFKVNN